MWQRGYVYDGGQLLALQYESAVTWVHQDPVVKSQRLTNASGSVTAGVELDPWGGDTARSWSQHLQPQRFTTYLRDQNESDEAMMRRYNRWWGRFDQPDPWDGAYDLADPQSFNRYAYTQNDPVNYTDPLGLFMTDPNDDYMIPAWRNGWNQMYTVNPWQWHENMLERGWRFNDGVAWVEYTFINFMLGGAWRGGLGAPPNSNSGRNESDDPCDSAAYTSAIQSDLSKIATTIGGKLDAKWNIRTPRRLAVKTAVGRLENLGFVQFHSYNPEHPGVNLQGQLNGRWYHVTVTPVSTPNAAVNANQRASGPNSAINSSRNNSPSRVNKVTAHCEKNKPDSAAHFWDYLKSFFW